MDDYSEEELLALQKIRTERTMKITVTILACIFLYVFYFLLKNG